MGGFIQDLKGPLAKAPEDFHDKGPECVAWAVVVCAVLLLLLGIFALSSGAGRAAGARDEIGAQGGDIGSVDDSGPGAGVEVGGDVATAHGVVAGACAEAAVTRLAATGAACTAQRDTHVRVGGVVAALGQPGELGAVERMSDVVAVDPSAAAACPWGREVGEVANA